MRNSGKEAKQSKGELAAWRSLERELRRSGSDIEKALRVIPRLQKSAARVVAKVPHDARARARAAEGIEDFSREMAKTLHALVAKVAREHLKAMMAKRMR